MIDARRIEADAHSSSTTKEAYLDKMSQLVFNLRARPDLSLEEDLVFLMDEEMAEGTVVEDIAKQAVERQDRFERMFKEKHERLNDRRGIDRCRRCGSDEVTCDQKQTRSADEAMSLFFSCSKCKLRWTLK